jgi:hypothetical protein
MYLARPRKVLTSEGLAAGPVMDLGNLGVIGDAAFIVAPVSEDDDFRDSNE